MKSQFNVSRLKTSLIVIGVLNLVVVSLQSKASEVEHLYMQDGDVQVSKVVRKNAMGGEVIEYVKTRVEPEVQQQAKNIEKEKPDAASETRKANNSEVAFTKKVETISITAQLAQFEPIKELKLPQVMPKEGLTIKAEGGSGSEKALLEKVKALKAAKEKVAAYEDLNLAPGEKLVEENKKKIKPIQKKAKKPRNSRRPEDAVISRLEFNQANILDVARALADISNLNFIATEEAAKKNVTVFLQNITVINALEAITKNSGLWYRRDKDSQTYRIMTTEEYQRDLVVYREDVTRVFNLLNPNPILVATAISDLYGSRVVLSYGSDYDDFYTGEFNSASSGGSSSGSRGSPAGSGLSGGQSSLRRGVTSGNSRSNSRRAGRVSEAKSGTSDNGAITEKLSVDQIKSLEGAMKTDENGNVVSSSAIRGISRAQQPIYITISQQQNLIIVRSSDAEVIKEIEHLVKAMDKPTTQVLLEMKILEIDVGDAYNQLFSFGALSSNGKSFAGARENDELSGTGKFVYQFIDDLIGIKLELLEKNNKAKTVSSPILLASNNRTARLFVGEERLLIRGATLTDPVLGINGQVTTPGKITYETEIRNVGNTLNITPKINADGTVALGIFQDTSSVNEGAVEFPPLIATNGDIFNFSIDTVDTANIEGVVVAKDGLTVAIGGLIRTSASKEESKVPVLGDIPLFGNIFKDKIESASRKELILLVTPHIITAPTDTDDISRDAVEPLSAQQW